jgi:hypothetical protein
VAITNAAQPAATSAEHDNRPPTIGVDPGAVWTAAVLRVRDQAVHGWTIGPLDRFGLPARRALSDPDDWAALHRYLARVIDNLDELVDYARRHYGAVRVGIETPKVPVGYQPGSGKYNRLPLVVWLVPKLVTAGVLAVFPDARRVLPDHLAQRPTAEYPRELRGSRPPEWGPNETPKHERDHERAAYDVAGLAASLP